MTHSCEQFALASSVCRESATVSLPRHDILGLALPGRLHGARTATTVLLVVSFSSSVNKM
jgi:hypothetical protein